MSASSSKDEEEEPANERLQPAGQVARKPANVRCNGHSAPGPISKESLVFGHDDGGFLRQKYDMVKAIATGSFGKLMLVRCKGTNIERVCKIVSTRKLDPTTRNFMVQEVQTLQKLDHPHIVKIYEFAIDPRSQRLYLILENLEGGDCLDLLHQHGTPLDEPFAGRIIQQVLSAITYCHARGILHRDIKPENIMLSCESTAETVDCKVIDFGLMATFNEAEADGIVCKDFVGTPSYMAPEMARVQRQRSAYGIKADVWAVGVTAWELLTGRPPFGKPVDYGNSFQPIVAQLEVFDEKVLKTLLNRKEWQSRSEPATEFIEALLQPDVEQRPTASEALRLQWLDTMNVIDAGLTKELLKGLRAYVAAPHEVKVCLMLIAAKSRSKEMKPFQNAFAQLDKDGDGLISLDELEEALAAHRSCWRGHDDTMEIFEAIDLDHGGFIEYTEFVGACLYAELFSVSGRELSQRAFQALDLDGDGKVTVEEVDTFFKTRRSEPLLRGLPRSRPFVEEEFYHCLMEEAKADMSRPDFASLLEPQYTSFQGDESGNSSERGSQPSDFFFGCCGCSKVQIGPFKDSGKFSRPRPLFSRESFDDETDEEDSVPTHSKGSDSRTGG